MTYVHILSSPQSPDPLYICSLQPPPPPTTPDLHESHVSAVPKLVYCVTD